MHLPLTNVILSYRDITLNRKCRRVEWSGVYGIKWGLGDVTSRGVRGEAPIRQATFLSIGI